jgi:peptidyl-tRNA hydrolase
MDALIREKRAEALRILARIIVAAHSRQVKAGAGTAAGAGDEREEPGGPG